MSLRWHLKHLLIRCCGWDFLYRSVRYAMEFLQPVLVFRSFRRGIGGHNLMQCCNVYFSFKQWCPDLSWMRFVLAGDFRDRTGQSDSTPTTCIHMICRVVPFCINCLAQLGYVMLCQFARSSLFDTFWEDTLLLSFIHFHGKGQDVSLPLLLSFWLHVAHAIFAHFCNIQCSVMFWFQDLRNRLQRHNVFGNKMWICLPGLQWATFTDFASGRNCG